MTWESSDLERARASAERALPPRLSLARRFFPGLVAAAASAGVIVGDGWRSGTPWTPFVQLGVASLASLVSSLLPDGVYAITGLIVHTFWLVLWGACFTAVARSLRGGKLFISALILTAALAIIARVFLPSALGAAELSLMSSAHVTLYVATIAVALSVGTRLARYG